MRSFLVLMATLATFTTATTTLADPPHRIGPTIPKPARLTTQRPQMPIATGALGKESLVYRATRRLLDKTFIEHETRRFIVLSDTDAVWTRSQAEHLERTWHQFERTTRRLGMTLAPLEHKQVCVLFRSRAEYQKFAREHDDVTTPNIAGYYSPRNGRIVFYHVEDNPSVIEARARLGEIRGQIKELENRIKGTSGPRTQMLEDTVVDLRSQADREAARIDEFTHRVGIATTIHEATHQLLFHTDIQSRDHQYPLWICEGLATAFETDRPSQAFGPDHEYAPRRQQCNELFAESRYLPLRELLTILDLDHHACGQLPVVYHQSYSIVTWMFRFRRAELQRYLNAMRSHPARTMSVNEHLDVFETAFGDIDRLERAWLKNERRLAEEAIETALRDLLLSDDVLAELTESGAMRAESVERLRQYAVTGDVHSQD